MLNKEHKIYALLGYLAALEGLITLFVVFAIPGDPKNAVLLGYSLERLLIAAGNLILAGGFLSLAIGLSRKKTWSERILAWMQTHPRKMFLSLTLILGLGWALAWTPGYRFGAWQAHFERLYPFILWLFVVGIQTTYVYLRQSKLEWDGFKAEFQRDNSLKLWAGVTAVFFLLWVWIAWSKTGLTPDTDYWNEAGVPVLNSQILAGLGIAGLATLLMMRFRKYTSDWRLDLGLFLLIWAVAAWVWAKEPLLYSYFLRRPIAPNYEYYPFSDAAYYDIGGQYVLLGQGINNGNLTDKPLYSLLLAGMHALGGQSYERVINIQVLVLALLPAVLYLIGKKLHSRALGLLVAVFAIFKEKNALESTIEIKVAHSKLMLSEMPVALALAAFTLLAILWFSNVENRRVAALWAGGILGTAALIRPHPLAILPFLLIGSMGATKKISRAWLGSVLFFCLGTFLVFGPWTGYVQIKEGNNFLIEKVMRVLKRQKHILPEPTPNSYNQTDAYADLILPENLKSSSIGVLQLPAVPAAGDALQENADTIANFTENFPEHFWHNQVTSMLIFPIAFRFDDIQHTVSQPIWDLGWTGEMSLENKIFLSINLILIALGISALWKKHRMMGLVPLIVNMAYHLANAFSRTSGSRYIIPVDWVWLIYYGFGLLQVVNWASVLLQVKSKTNHAEENAAVTGQVRAGVTLSGYVPALLVLCLIGLSLPLSGMVVKPGFNHPPESKVWVQLSRNNQDLQKQFLSQKLKIRKIPNFLKGKGGVLLHGRALYPRYFHNKRGECDICNRLDLAYQRKSYSRLGFTLIGKSNAGVILPLGSKPEIPNYSEVYVIGCVTSTRRIHDIQLIDALAVIVVQGDKQTLYVRPRLPADLTCPFNKK